MESKAGLVLLLACLVLATLDKLQPAVLPWRWQEVVTALLAMFGALVFVVRGNEKGGKGDG
jgi:hypothetical protein